LTLASILFRAITQLIGVNSISVGKTAVFADLDALLEFPGELLIAVGYGLQMDCDVGVDRCTSCKDIHKGTYLR
jgi:hypothetical protein